MSAPDDRKRVLVVSLKKEAQPVLEELRTAGHQVSLVEDLDEARPLLASAGFDQAVVAASSLALLLEQRLLWEGIDADAWRRSAAGIAYDLRHLLQALESSVQELDERRSTDFTPAGDFIQIRRTVSVLSGFLLELTNELSSGAGRELTLRVVDLEDIVETAAMAVYPSAAERRQRLVIDVESGVSRVSVDATKMKRALTRLLSHASGECASQGTIKVRGWRDDDGCIISVSYQGDTMTISELRRLFAPASNPTDPACAGLPIVQRLIQQHGGRVWVESQKDADTSIFLSIPRSIAGPEQSLAHLAHD